MPAQILTQVGVKSSPWLTVYHAINTVPAGSTIILRAGTYREGTSRPTNTQFTIQPYPHEQAWLKGSVIVTNWTQSGNYWYSTGWTTQFANDADPNAINSNYPLAGYRDMVFVNGVALTCAANPTVAGGQSAVGPGKFYINYTNHTIYLGNNPTGKTVEVAAQQMGINTWATGTVVRGLGFQHYATGYNPGVRGALRRMQ